MTVAELHSRMSACEFAEWQAYDSIEPFGDERADLRQGVIGSLLANIYRDKKKRSRPFEALDFMPIVRRNIEFNKAMKPVDDEEVAATARHLFSGIKKRTDGKK